MKNRLTRILTVILTVFLLADVLVTPLCAAYSGYYGSDDAVKRAFATDYHWDTAKMDQYSWSDQTGRAYQRSSSYQKTIMEDVLATNEGLAVDLGLISPVSELKQNAKSLIELALREWEDGNGEMIDNFGRGTDNVKYNTWYYRRTVSNRDTDGNGKFDYGDTQFYPWCCVFMSWIADRCGLIEAGTFIKTAACDTMYAYFMQRGYDHWAIKSSTPYGGSNEPMPGDVLIWGNCEHIGLIVAVNEKSIETVEGNSGEIVAHHTYKKSDLTGDLGNGTIFRVEYPDAEGAVYGYLVNTLFLQPSAAVGVVAAITRTSNFNTAKEIKNPDGTLRGICLWDDGRWERFKRYCESTGYELSSLMGQMYFMGFELEAYYPSLKKSLMNTPSSKLGAYQAAWEWLEIYQEEASTNTCTMISTLAADVYWPRYVESGLVRLYD